MVDNNESSNADPVSEYLYSPIVKNIKNPLAYWKSIVDSQSDPTQTAFAQMAIDFLSAPGKSICY